MTNTGDPSTHAEMQAVRRASQVLGSPGLEGVTVYAIVICYRPHRPERLQNPYKAWQQGRNT